MVVVLATVVAVVVVAAVVVVVAAVVVVVVVARVVVVVGLVRSTVVGGNQVAAGRGKCKHCVFRRGYILSCPALAFPKVKHTHTREEAEQHDRDSGKNGKRGNKQKHLK